MATQDRANNEQAKSAAADCPAAETDAVEHEEDLLLQPWVDTAPLIGDAQERKIPVALQFDLNTRWSIGVKNCIFDKIAQHRFDRFMIEIDDKIWFQLPVKVALQGESSIFFFKPVFECSREITYFKVKTGVAMFQFAGGQQIVDQVFEPLCISLH